MNGVNISIRQFKGNSILLGIFLFLTGCPYSVSFYDSNTYKNLTDLKAVSGIVYDKLAADPSAKSLMPDLEGLRLDIEKAYEYEKGKSKNDDTIRQLTQIREEFAEMYNKIVKGDVYPKAQISIMRINMMEHFDKAIKTEKMKIDEKKG